jgi:hypothetical protein
LRARVETAISSACGAGVLLMANGVSASSGLARTIAAIGKLGTRMHAMRDMMVVG